VRKSTTPAFDESFDFKVDKGRLATTTLTIQIKNTKKHTHNKGGVFNLIIQS
jgi:hypothetical protein